MAPEIGGNVIVCYFLRNATDIVAALRDKKQLSFLMQLLSDLSPIDIECLPNCVEVTCGRQIAASEMSAINQKLLESAEQHPGHRPLLGCRLMLKVCQSITN